MSRIPSHHGLHRGIVLGMAALAWCLGFRITVHAQVYQIDTTRTTVAFAATHMGVLRVEGQFRSFTGTITYDAKDPATVAANVIIDAASIDTSHRRRDQSLRSAAFFDVETYPHISFRTTMVTALTDTVYQAEGVLAFWDKEQPITFSFDLGHPSFADMTRLEGQATFTLSRKALGLSFGSSMDGLIGDDVTVRLVIVAVASP